MEVCVECVCVERENDDDPPKVVMLQFKSFHLLLEVRRRLPGTRAPPSKRASSPLRTTSNISSILFIFVTETRRRQTRTRSASLLGHILTLSNNLGANSHKLGPKRRQNAHKINTAIMGTKGQLSPENPYTRGGRWRRPQNEHSHGQ